MEFSVFHAYNRLVAQGRATRLTCPHCGHNVTTVMERTVIPGGGDDPMLHCYGCGSTMDPGLDLYRRLERAVEDELNEY